MKQVLSSAWEGLSALAGAAILIGALAAPPRARAQQTVDRVVASVDGEPITTRDIAAFAAANRVTLASPDDTDAPTTREVLKGLISERLLESEVKKYSGQVDENQIKSYMKDFEHNAGLTDDQLRAQLQAQGVTYEQFREHARMEIEKMLMIDKEVRQKVNISPDEVKAYYDAHPGEFTVKKERFKLAQILIALPPNPTPAQVEEARNKAEDIRKQAVSGGDFAALARQYSDDDSKGQGGELGDFSRGEVLDPIQSALDQMKPGDISEPIRTEHGFHIVKLEEHDAPGVKPLAEVSAKIRDKLMTDKAKNQFAKWVETDLVKQHYVETLY
ncbi:MAG TPA: peptidylprolyl isomerase [Candidatus Binataceae bacterium]|jgi:peptidyl-prolyl cis-trans isomerase SurA|nr:peptidylprolyl isomerase [Candidatus Binataceae bacterium]